MGATEPAADAVLRAARELHAATEVLFDAVAGRYGINRNDLRCLELIERDGPLGPGRLAILSGLSPAAVTKVLDRLEAAEYVVRRPSPTDRRAQLIEPSDHHLDRRHAVWNPLITEAATVLSALPNGDLHKIETTLHHLAKLHRTHAANLAPPADPPDLSTPAGSTRPISSGQAPVPRAANAPMPPECGPENA